MVNSKQYKGIEYVLLNELPDEQKKVIQETLGKDHFIKILADGKILKDCVQYKDYRSWFEKVFQPQRLNLQLVQK